jgi:GDPmannose 4,6-dehydratase
VYLGNLDALRDWGYAKDFVRAIWLMLQQDEPDDYVIGTGEAHTVRDFCEMAFALVGLDWSAFTKVDPAYFRPTEVESLRANPDKAAAKLGWKPETTFEELVTLMVTHDLADVGLDLDSARERAAGFEKSKRVAS